MRSLTEMQEDFMHRADYVVAREVKPWESLGHVLKRFDLNVMDIPAEFGGAPQDMLTQLLALEDVAYNSIDLALMLIESYFVQDMAKCYSNNDKLYKYIACHVADGKGFAAALLHDKPSAPMIARNCGEYWKFDGVALIDDSTYYDSSVVLIPGRTTSGVVYAFIPTRLLSAVNNQVNIINMSIPASNVVNPDKRYLSMCAANTDMRYTVAALGATRAISNRIKTFVDPNVLMRIEAYIELCRHQMEHICDLFLKDLQFDFELYTMKLGLTDLFKFLMDNQQLLNSDEVYLITTIAERWR